MPNIYRQKICPQCYTEHRQRGPYCSKSCSNAARITKDSTREKRRESMYEYMAANPEVVEDMSWRIQASKDEREEGLPLPPDHRHDYTVEDGDVWK